MSETPRPVRAWAEWDAWQVFVDCVSPDWFRIWSIPRSGAGEADNMNFAVGIAEAIDSLAMDETHGPLRAIRILLSTGQQIELVRKADSVTIAQGRSAVMLEPGCMKFSLFASDGAWLHGGWYMPEVADTDAVTRALSEATNWLNEAAKAAE